MMSDLSGSATVNASPVSHKGCFVMWQMLPEKWLIELVGGGHKISAGSDGEIAWRYTPWLGDHAAKGAIRPLRRTLQVSIYIFVLIKKVYIFVNFYFHQYFIYLIYT